MKMKAKIKGVPVLNARQQKQVAKASEKQCLLLVCIDEKTGRLKMLRGEKCPPGYFRRVNNALSYGVDLDPDGFKD